MKLDKLQYQLDAIEKAMSAINKNDIAENENFYANPILQNTQGIDVKMETGTGKTYVYTRLMHELKRQFGFFKFIILVPSVAIKEGVKMSILSEEWNKHFRQEFGGQTINFGVINAGDFDVKKGKRKQIPVALSSFCEATKAEEKSVQVLLLNDAMLASSSMTRKDYDSTLFGSITCPLEGLQNTQAIVIIDEPHRFKKDGKAWENIKKGLKPQLIIRFGATFPEISVGTGKNKTTKKDYENLVYDLNSVRAFNDGLVKGVAIQYPAIPNVSDDGNVLKCKVVSINKDGAKLKGATFSVNNRNIEIAIGGAMSAVNENFDDVTLELDGKNLVLSNGANIETGISILPQTYSMNYQEILLKQALDAHFEKEKQNFFRPNNAPKIKTNSLFFIDSISSFRGDNENERGWLRAKFEELLKKQFEKEIAVATGEYKQFLEFSLRNIEKCSAGYFSQDNSDKAVQEEIDLVLRNKEQSLKFKNEKGEWNVCRFFFSKWTLCEGWDNPNVFVITKLRSSGSENRKIQEVGRGLRLPFDESGRRISNEDFYLTYIIDYSEREFAKKLVGEINLDGGLITENKITEELINILIKSGYETTKFRVVKKLVENGIIDENDEVLNAEELRDLLPENERNKISKAGNVKGEGCRDEQKIKLHKENFEKLRSLWREVTKRYLLHFEKLDENELKSAILEIAASDDVFMEYSAEIVEAFTEKGENKVELRSGGFSAIKSNLGKLQYGEFIKRLHTLTSLPLDFLHKAIIEARKNKNTPQEFFNICSLINFAEKFREKFEEIFAQKYDYYPLDFTANTSLFKPNSDEFVDELAQGLLGDKIANDFPNNDKFLYDKAAYDSDIEHEVLKIQPKNKIIVYGKLPKRSIKIPTYTGGTTSPDFVYAISRDSGKSLHLIVETKSENLRMSDTIAVEAQKKLFTQIPNVIWRKETNVANFERYLKGI